MGVKFGERSHYAITTREREVLDALLENGDSNKALAERLGISPATVETHLCNLMDKTGFSSRTELAVNLLHQRYQSEGLVGLA